MFAWCFVQYGGLTQEKATLASSVFYQYETSEETNRGLIFHDEAWHWAMLKIMGEQYWHLHPDLEKPSQDYLIESESFEWLCCTNGKGLMVSVKCRDDDL